ncbi:MAG: carboxynorspermidine decarboxylase [Selenomonadaceae bacterium]|nr:carboxynorspermidine decarboxylase [Selenomonadaceae bacterium]
MGHSSWDKVPTPAYVVHKELLEKNLEILVALQEDTGAKILLAQKCFSMYYYYPLISKYLSGTASSGLYEARLSKEYFKKENHTFSPAFKADEFSDIIKYSDHIVFNSFNQLKKFGEKAKSQGVSVGLRLNPEHSTQKDPIYDPAAPGSRLGVPIGEFMPEEIDILDGFHMHTLCEQGAEPLYETVQVLEKKFGEYFKGKKWINLGGGHHITKPGYNMELLKKIIEHFQDKYNLEVYLEPGEAVALNAGFLVTTVLEANENLGFVIIDASAACHMPDVLEMPYRPEILGAYPKNEKPYSYKIGSATCLAGDVVGEYSFEHPLKEGDRLVFSDMAIYSMVKNNTFNGMPLPAIVAVDGEDYDIVKKFGYEDFLGRLS